MKKSAFATAFLWTLAPLLAQATASPDARPDTRQVHWQRSLDDALALCKATSRPLLIAVNMDGESASDRIVHEEYVDPAFVALTRHCVCLGASVFRHNARDHDDDGSRIPCPRFGGITCGEHMALEPQLWEKYLSDGERVAPRHALVLSSGKKAFDLSLCFDLKDIDRALEPAIPEVPGLDLSVPADADWAMLAARRDCCGRQALEAAIANVRTHDAATLLQAIAAIAAHGDMGSLDALRLVFARLPGAENQVVGKAIQAAASVGGAHADDLLLRELAQALRVPGEPGPDARQRAALNWWCPEAGSLASQYDTADASFLLACVAVGGSSSNVLGDKFGFDLTHGGMADATQQHGGPVSLAGMLKVANAVAVQQTALPLTGGPTDAMPEAAELERTLEQLDRTPKDQRADAEWCARFAKASLDLARRRIEQGGKDAPLLLDDAENYFVRALSRVEDRYEWWIERARAAYFRSQFAIEQHCGLRAFALVHGKEAPPSEGELANSPVLRDARAIEALRWVADGCARLLGTQADPRLEWRLGKMIDGLRAFGIVAASPYGSDQDWISFASFTASLGLLREAEAIAQCGAMRYPTSRDLRQELNMALIRCARPDLATVVAAGIEHSHAPSADASWHLGYAWMLAAEDHRRREQPRAAFASYEAAERWFVRAAEQHPDYCDNCLWMRACCAFGAGMACAQEGSQTAAAEQLVNAVGLHGDLAQLKDGLACDVFDLVDRALEWRATGPSPVDPMRLLADIDKHAPDTPFYAAAISDALLREALRADGRNPVRKPRRTVDAGGNPIIMPMGLPNAEGDRYLLASIEAGRVAAARAQSRDDKVPLLQSLTIWAERGYERGDDKGVREALAEAAPLLELPAPAAAADDAALRALCAQLRSQLGEARPRWRDGR